MSNAELFKKVFGIYAEEFWAYPEEKMLDWLTSVAPDINVGDTIYRQAAIEYFVTNVGFHDEDGYPIEDSDELRKIWTEYFDGIPSAQPELDEWCTDCKEYDSERNYCPRFGRVIRHTLDEVAPRWIPVTEQTLPKHNSVVVVCGNKGTWDYGTYRGHIPNHIDFWNWKKNTVKEVHWWMYKADALPEPPKGEEDD